MDIVPIMALSIPLIAVLGLAVRLTINPLMKAMAEFKQIQTGGSTQEMASLQRRLAAVEQHLEGMRRALDGTNAENNGFLRDSAHLAVIFIADEDDCSATSGALFDPTQDSVTDPLGPRTSVRCAEFGYECDGAPIGREPRQLDEPGGQAPRGRGIVRLQLHGTLQAR